MTTTPELATYLEFVAKVSESSKKSYLKYGSHEAFVLAEGRPMEHLRPVPNIERGELGQCYRNSLLFVTDNGREFSYCEGWAYSTRLPIPLQHAWVLNSEGKVIDPTWSDEEVYYYGVEFDFKFVAEFCINVGYYGILGNDYLNDCSLLRWGGEGKVKR